MSYVENRQTEPEIYNYAGTNTVNSYIAPGQPIEPVTIHRTSNVQPVVANQPVGTSNQRTSQFKGSTAQQVVSSDKRFNAYIHVNEYKYNLFSLIDEPWNRCLQLGKCGSCPGNECITRQSRRGVWNWN